VRLRHAAFVLPNLFTLASLLCGFLAVAASARGTPDDLYHAGLAILFGTIFDAFDGRVARLTRTQSLFGMQLDSLADLVTFGVAPAALAYAWALAPLGWVGAAVAFVWVAAGAIRLARFNVLALRAEGAPGTHIVGLPIPCAAALVVALSLFAFEGAPAAPLAVIMVTLSLLMVSAIPFPSFKTGVARRRTLFAVILVTVSGAAIWVRLSGWAVFLFLATLYVALGLVDALAPTRRARLS
jgi:CDP-diacylglycerol--serine O-phosphatidyltransferase